MRRFLPEIAFGLATAAMMLQSFNLNRWNFASPFLYLVIVVGSCVGYISLRRRVVECERDQAVETAREGYREADRQSKQRAGNASDAEVRALATQGRKIEAIKMHRELHGGGLREAVDHVEALARGPIGY